MTYQKGLAAVISILLILAFVYTPIHYGMEQLQGGVAFRKRTPYNEAELYPFENKEEGNAIIGMYHTLSRAFTTNSEKLYSRYCPFRYTMIEQYGRFNKLICNKIYGMKMIQFCELPMII